jgi:hypothetical protein
LTGETGKALVDEMLETNVFSKIFLIGRRKVEYTEEKYSHLVGQLQEKHVLAVISMAQNPSNTCRVTCLMVVSLSQKSMCEFE